VLGIRQDTRRWGPTAAAKLKASKPSTILECLVEKTFFPECCATFLFLSQFEIAELVAISEHHVALHRRQQTPSIAFHYFPITFLSSLVYLVNACGQHPNPEGSDRKNGIGTAEYQSFTHFQDDAP